MRQDARKGVKLFGAFVLFVALAAVVSSTLALAPHDEAEGPSCLVCKARNQPFEIAASPAGPLSRSAAPSSVVELFEDQALPELVRLCSPRAPPV